jgi:general secretion pathway protein I
MRLTHPSAVKQKKFMPDPRRSGFTLLEVLVALAILGIALVAVFELFSANMKGIVMSDDYVTAVMKAESKMREILDDDNLAEKSWDETTDDGYRINAAVTEAAADRTENLQVKLMEISLTIHWTRGTQERSFTLKTMKMVNKQV